MVETRIERATKLLRKKTQPAQPIQLNRSGYELRPHRNGAWNPEPDSFHGRLGVAYNGLQIPRYSGPKTRGGHRS